MYIFGHISVKQRQLPDQLPDDTLPPAMSGLAHPFHVNRFLKNQYEHSFRDIISTRNQYQDQMSDYGKFVPCILFQIYQDPIIANCQTNPRCITFELL